MNLFDIGKYANSHCWLTDAEDKLNYCMKRYNYLKGLPEDHEEFREWPKKRRLEFASSEMKHAFEHWSKLKEQTARGEWLPYHWQCIRRFTRLSPDKGYLRLMKAIIYLTEANGAKPHKKDCQSYVRVMSGRTYLMDQLFAALRKMGLCSYDNGWAVTLHGKALLKAKGCLA